MKSTQKKKIVRIYQPFNKDSWILSVVFRYTISNRPHGQRFGPAVC